MKLLPVLVFAVSLLALVHASGCSKKENAKAAAQVAARVNADEITVPQVDFALARSQNVARESADIARREILDKLIDQQLVRQKAIENHLDRTPNVIQAIEAAKSEVLARAYLEQVTAAIPKPAAWETRKYFEEHPELFMQRRLFDLEELVFMDKVDVASALQELLSRGQSMQEIADWLQSRGVKFVANRGTRAAEQLPLDIVPKLQAMKAGQTRLFESGGGRFQVIRVLAFKTEPMDEPTATPRIQQYLFNRRSSEVIAREMKKLKEQAKIEYAGEFSGGTAAAEQKVEAGAKAQTRSEELPKGPPRK